MVIPLVGWYAAWIDLVHFMLVFLSVFITYVVAGILFFGRDIPTFTTFLLQVGDGLRNARFGLRVWMSDVRFGTMLEHVGAHSPPTIPAIYMFALCASDLKTCRF